MASNLTLLEEVAARLKHLLPEVVFVGGATLDLLVTDQGSGPVRSTYDVDVIVAADYVNYAAFCDRLRDIGFENDARPGAPLCRFLQAVSCSTSCRQTKGRLASPTAGTREQLSRLLTHDHMQGPCSPLIFRNLRTCRFEDHGSLLSFAAREPVSVQLRGHHKGGKRDSLVAIRKRVVPEKCPGQRGCYSPDTFLAGVVVQLLRTRHCRFQAVLVAYTRQTAVGLDQLRLHGTQDIAAQEGKAHFASSR